MSISVWTNQISIHNNTIGPIGIQEWKHHTLCYNVKYYILFKKKSIQKERYERLDLIRYNIIYTYCIPKLFSIKLLFFITHNIINIIMYCYSFNHAYLLAVTTYYMYNST